MSEYQYYEFRAIDRPLDEDERDELRALSTRAEITSRMKLRLMTATATPPVARSRIAIVMFGCASPNWLTRRSRGVGLGHSLSAAESRF